jgi:hypothetical protein
MVRIATHALQVTILSIICVFLTVKISRAVLFAAPQASVRPATIIIHIQEMEGAFIVLSVTVTALLKTSATNAIPLTFFKAIFMVFHAPAYRLLSL